MTSQTRLCGTALAAFMFGALVYGPSNAFFGHRDGAHHHHGAQFIHHATAQPWDVPAHCLFCLDGITPQPTELTVVAETARLHHAAFSPSHTALLRSDLRVTPPPSRAPPSVTS